MTNSYHLLLPSLFVCSLCYLLSRGWTIYVEQPKNMRDSPAHADDFFPDLLRGVTAGELLQAIPQTPWLREDQRFADLKALFGRTGQPCFPVCSAQGALVGLIVLEQIKDRLVASGDDTTPLRELTRACPHVATPDESLRSLAGRLFSHSLGAMPVTQDKQGLRYLGMIRRQDIAEFHADRLRQEREGVAPNDSPGGS